MKKKKKRKKRFGGCYGSGEVLVSESCCCALVLHAHGQVDKGEDVVLDHDGEAEEDGIQDEDINAQLHVQPPFIQVDSQDLRIHKHISVACACTFQIHQVGLCRHQYAPNQISMCTGLS